MAMRNRKRTAVDAAVSLLILLVASASCQGPPAPNVASPTSASVENTPAPQVFPSASAILPSATPLDQPSGKIVYTCQISGRSDLNQICIMQADGTGSRVLTTVPNADHLYPSLSPTGDAVVFTSNMGAGYDIYELREDGSAGPIRLTGFGDAYAPAISPDGQTIVFTRSDGVWRQLWMMSRSGADPVPISDPAWGGAWDASWSPDGRSLLLASDHPGSTQLFTIELENGEFQQVSQLANLRGRNDWSPDGRYAATYQGLTWAREIVEIDLASGEVEQLTRGGNNLAPSYSPDGKWLTFTSYRDSFGDDNGCEIYIMHRASGEIRRLTDNDYCDWQPRWGR